MQPSPLGSRQQHAGNGPHSVAGNGSAMYAQAKAQPQQADIQGCSSQGSSGTSAQPSAAGEPATNVDPAVLTPATDHRSLPAHDSEEASSHRAQGAGTKPATGVAGITSRKIVSARPRAVGTPANTTGGRKGRIDYAANATVRMVQLPGGRLIDARKVPGIVTMPDGRRIACPRCRGTGYVDVGKVFCRAACWCLHNWSRLSLLPKSFWTCHREQCKCLIVSSHSNMAVPCSTCLRSGGVPANACAAVLKLVRTMSLASAHRKVSNL